MSTVADGAKPEPSSTVLKLQQMLSTAEERALVDALDADHDGSLSAHELAAALHRMIEAKHKNTRLRQTSFALLGLLVLALAANAGLTFAVVELSKETTVKNGRLVEAGTDTSVSTAAVSTNFELSVSGAAGGLSEGAVTSLKGSLIVGGADGSKSASLAVDSVERGVLGDNTPYALFHMREAGRCTLVSDGIVPAAASLVSLDLDCDEVSTALATAQSISPAGDSRRSLSAAVGDLEMGETGRRLLGKCNFNVKLGDGTTASYQNSEKNCKQVAKLYYKYYTDLEAEASECETLLAQEQTAHSQCKAQCTATTQPAPSPGDFSTNPVPTPGDFSTNPVPAPSDEVKIG